MTPKELSEFLRLLAHDLQNQIGSVDLNLQVLPTLLESTSPAAQEVSKEIAPFISRASLSASEMIETLSDVQRFAYSLGGTAQPHQAQLDLAALLRDALLHLKPSAEARGLTVSLGSVEEGTVLAERDGVLSAVRLFAGEALRSSFPNSTLILSSCKSAARLNSVGDQFSILIEASQGGLFEAERPTLATFLAKEALKASNVEVQVSSTDSQSAVRLLFL